MTGCDSTVDDMVKQLVAGKLFADHKAMNAVGSALGYDHQRQERIYKGRSPGAGAGGYNRDLSSIEHRIDDARVKIDILNGELVRRLGSDRQRS